MATATAADRVPRIGIEQWDNPLNGFTVVRTHYTADPAKRTPEWKREAQRGMHPRAWRREYDIDWASPEGEPVVPEYDEQVHVADFDFDPGLRLLRFWDFGFDSPVVLFAQLTHWDQLYIHRELCPFNTTLRQLVPTAEAIAKSLLGPDRALVGEQSIDYTGRDDEDDAEADPLAAVFAQAHRPPGVDPYGRVSLGEERRTFDAGDPEGHSRKSLGIESQVMGQYGLRLHTSRPGTKASYANLRQRFLEFVMIPNRGRQPKIVVHSRCRLLRQALKGAFCRSSLPPYRPKAVHPFKDVVDALRYGNDNVATVQGGHDTKIRAMARQDIVETRQ